MAKRKSKVPGDDPYKRELGEKVRAGRMISEFIRAIGSELTETVLDDSAESPGPPRLVSKAESLARHIWRKALPHKEHADGKMIDVEPDLDYVRMVIDRSDGKPGTEKTDGNANNEALPDRISRMSTGRLNGFADEAGGE